jgi:2,4-dienoyl-CoA reductase-like NADH-dependent reductase (Old Yellow Enzyme family)
MSMSHLFSPFTLRRVTLRNRTVVAPMCQYKAVGGHANDWHMVHLGRFALGGFGLVILEATAVTPDGRISYADLGLWDDAQIAGLARITSFLRAHGAAAGLQLAHAGRKAATPVWWRGAFNETEAEKAECGYETWTPVAPSAIAHSDDPDFQVPEALDRAGIARLVEGFAAAAVRAERAGFDLVEIHGAHGYLVNQFLSPVANKRTDNYGGSRENRMRFLLEVTEAVRAVWPADKPLLVRLSVQDGREDGWTVADSAALVPELAARGVDMVDCSSGGFAGATIRPGPGYQVPLAAAVRAAGLPSMAVGLIQDADDAEAILRDGHADLVALARGALDDPNWPLHARHMVEPGDAAYDLWPITERGRIRDKDRVLGLRSFAQV